MEEYTKYFEETWLDGHFPPQDWNYFNFDSNHHDVGVDISSTNSTAYLAFHSVFHNQPDIPAHSHLKACQITDKVFSDLTAESLVFVCTQYYNKQQVITEHVQILV